MSTRQRFEEWFGAPQTLVRQTDGSYKYHAAETAWETWKASAEDEREECAKVAECGVFLHDDAPDAGLAQQA